MIPGTLLGLMVAVALGAYNYLRFGNIFEFGHNYLPEFSTQGGIQFSLSHVAKNVQTFIFTLPFNPTGSMNAFGFSFVFVNPVLLLMLFWFVSDLFKKRLDFVKGLTIALFLLHFFLLLLHRTFGGYQFGARYTCDLLIYPLIYLALPGRKRKMFLPEAMILIAGFAFNVYGAFHVLI